MNILASCLRRQCSSTRNFWYTYQSMAILGVDFGKKRIGLAISESGIQAYPLEVLQYASLDSVVTQLSLICTKQGVDTVVVGLPETDRIGAGKFGQQLSSELNVAVVFSNEDSTSKLAARKGKRGDFKDDLAAALMLQNYLDAQNIE